MNGGAAGAPLRELRCVAAGELVGGAAHVGLGGRRGLAGLARGSFLEEPPPVTIKKFSKRMSSLTK